MAGYLGDANSALAMYQGLSAGTPIGDVRAAANAAKLAGDISGEGALSTVGTDTLGGLNVYGGIERGGALGDTQAALAASQLGTQAAAQAGVSGAAQAASALSDYVPIAGMLLSSYMDSQTPAYTLNPSYYQKMSNALAAGPGAAANPNWNASQQDIQQQGNFWNAFLEAGTSNDPVEQNILKAYGLPQQVTPAVQNTQQYQDIMQNQPTGPSGTFHTGRMAQGGNVESNARMARLKSLYEGSFADRKKHFSIGGGNELGGTTGVGTPDFLAPYTPGASSSDLFDPSTTYNTTNNQGIFPATPTNNVPVDPSNLVTGGLTDVPNNAYTGGSGSVNNSGANATGSILGAGGALSGLGSALGVSSMGQLLQQYGALAPLLAAALGGNKPASAPATPAGYGAIPSIATPTNTRSYTQPNVANWYTYGEGPEQNFFSNNQLPNIPGVSPAQSSQASSPTQPSAPVTTAAPPGTTSNPNMTAQPYMGGPSPLNRATGGTFDSTTGDSYVNDPGHGDGTSDDIDAKLSGGEYVMDAGTVSMLGNGSNEAGSRALDQLRQRIRKHAGKQLVKGKQFMKAKPPETYLNGSKS
jgi:hypothetical protein